MREFADVIAAFKRAHGPAQLDHEFRLALHNRLVDQARFQMARPQVSEPSIVRRAIVGVAAVSAVSAAGLALLLMRHRAPSPHPAGGS